MWIAHPLFYSYTDVLHFIAFPGCACKPMVVHDCLVGRGILFEEQTVEADAVDGGCSPVVVFHKPYHLQ